MNTDKKILTILLDNGANDISDIDIINNTSILNNIEPKDAIQLVKDIRTLRTAPKELLMQAREEMSYVRKD